MSAEDLGMRELGQVRSQRLDEVSFLFLFCFMFLRDCFSLFTVVGFLLRKIHTVSRREPVFSSSIYSPTMLQKDYIPKALPPLSITDLILILLNSSWPLSVSYKIHRQTQGLVFPPWTSFSPTTQHDSTLQIFLPYLHLRSSKSLVRILKAARLSFCTG